MTYIARSNREEHTEPLRAQPLVEHLRNVSEQAGTFASKFGMADIARLIGILHDVGKYSDDFQKRVRGGNIKADHTTAGGKELAKLTSPIFSNIIFGHHGGLLNYGNNAQTGSDHIRSVSVRLKNETIPPYQHFEDEIQITEYLADFRAALVQKNLTTKYSNAFLIRMLFSCLVDADFLDAENFMGSSQVDRGNYQDIGTLRDTLHAFFDEKGFHTPSNPMGEIRSGILANCIQKANNKPGIFSLTVPTGGGKTYASMAFALNHAKEHGMDRIIYVIPYSSIIEQNAGVFKSALGSANVLENHSNVNIENTEDDLQTRHYLAAENWDIPIIVTTNVQFFESLYSHKTSKTRKLHNIAKSVLVFDEAQMLPTPYLKPCIWAIDELVKNYHCTAMLCTATQPALQNIWPTRVDMLEICDNYKDLYKSLKRTNYQYLQTLSDQQLVSALHKHHQVLCIVNTKKQAQNLYHLLTQDGDTDHVFHLSTQMCPAHRRKTLDTIRKQLADDKKIVLISTSLIEAGVDVNFQTVFRGKAGLDSIIQAAGRCNREGKQPASNSIVYIFDTQPEEYNIPDYIKQNIAATDYVFRNHTEIDTPEAIKSYFDFLYGLKGDALDSKNILKDLDQIYIPYEDISKKFELIETEGTEHIIISYNNEAHELIKTLQSQGISKTLMRQLNPYMLSIPLYQLKWLEENRYVQPIPDTNLHILATEQNIYDPHIGLPLAVEAQKAQAFFV